MISASSLAPAHRRMWRVVLPTRRRRWRIDAGDVALPRPAPRPPTIAVIGVAQATSVMTFDFGSR